MIDSHQPAAHVKAERWCYVPPAKHRCSDKGLAGSSLDRSCNRLLEVSPPALKRLLVTSMFIALFVCSCSGTQTNVKGVGWGGVGGGRAGVLVQVHW